MSEVIGGPSSTATATNALHRNVSTTRVVLAGVFVVLLLGAALANGEWPSQLVPAILGFATAIVIIAVAVIGWERQVDVAESEGLVKHYHQHPAEN